MTYPLKTPRLFITPLTNQDAAAFVAYRQDPNIARWQGWETSFTDSDAAELIASQPTTDLPDSGGWLQLAIRDCETGDLYGDMAIHTLDDVPDSFEIGITLAPESQHQGIASEAVARILEYLFIGVNARQVTANCDARNDAVVRLLAGSGMRKVSSQIDLEFFKDEWVALDGYAILKAEYATLT